MFAVACVYLVVCYDCAVCLVVVLFVVLAVCGAATAIVTVVGFGCLAIVLAGFADSGYGFFCFSFGIWVL